MTKERVLNASIFNSDMNHDVDVSIGINEMNRVSSPLSRSLQSFVDNISPLNRSKEMQAIDVSMPSEHKNNEASDISAMNASTLVAADIDRLLGLSGGSGEDTRSEDDIKDDTESPDRVDDEMELEKWMSRDMHKSLDKKFAGHLPFMVGKGTMNRLEKYIDKEALEVSLDTNSSDDDLDSSLQEQRTEARGSYSSTAIPSESDLIASIDIAYVTRRDDVVTEVRDSFLQARSSIHSLSNPLEQSHEEKANKTTILKDDNITIYVPERASVQTIPPKSIPKPLSSYVSPSPHSKTPDFTAHVMDMDHELRAELKSISARITTATKLMEVLNIFKGNVMICLF